MAMTACEQGALSPDPSEDHTPPSMPQGLVGTQVERSVELAWQAATDDVGVDGYVVYRDGQHLGTASGTAYVDAAVVAYVTYGYAVAAVDAAGNAGAVSDEALVTVEDVTAPSKPEGVVGTQNGTTLELEWQASTDDVGVDVYLVYRDAELLGTATGTEFSDDAAVATTTYRYAVAAMDAADNLSDLSEEAVVTVEDVTAPSAPQGLVGTQVGATVELQWQPAADDVGVTAYVVHRDGQLLGTVTGTQYIDTAVSSAATYSYTLVAVDAAGNQSGESNGVAVTIQDVTAPSVPQGLVGEQVGTAVQLQWLAATDDVGVTAYAVYRDGQLLATVTGTAHTDAAVVASASYTYAVTARDAGGNSSAESAHVVVPVADVTTPSVPQGLVAEQVGSTAELEWQASTDDVGVTGYRVYRNGQSLATATGSAYVDGTVEAETTYTYAVAARDAAGNESALSADAVVSVGDVTAPSVPQGLAAEQVGTTVELDWLASTDDVGVTAYQLYRDGQPLTTVTGTAYVDATVVAAVAYTYTVAARDAAGNESAQSADVVANVEDVTAPSAPQELMANQVGPVVELDWQPSTDDVGVTDYVVYRDGQLVTTVTGAAYTDGTVAAGATYTYAVSARDAAGNEGAQSADAVVSVTDVTAPSVPQGLAGVQVGTTVELDWQASTDDVGVTAYRLYRDGQPLTTVTGTSYTDGTVVAPVTYTYTVAARDAAANESGQSAAIVVDVEDVTAPTVPQGLAGVQVGMTVELDWQASTDDVGVTAYRVYRDTQLLTTVTGTAYTDGGVVANNTYTYTVAARDAAGNQSPQSSGVSVSVQPMGGGIALTNITDGTTGGPSPFGGHGVAFADVTGDGLVDFYVTNHLGVMIEDHFYRNLGAGSFVEEAAARGIDDLDFGSHGVVWADLDNDGDYDLYNGGTGQGDGASDLNRLYRRNPNGSFTDVTPAGSASGATRAVLAVDLEEDGDLDLLAVNGPHGQADDQPSEQFNEIYRNDGGLQFAYLNAGAFQQAPAGQGATGSDFDGDGDVDVFAANQGPLNVLENVGGTFVQRSAGSLGISGAHEARDGVTTADVDNDGHVDLLLAGNDYGHLYLNDGDGTFTYRRSFSNTEGYMGGFADLDNDGDLDLVFPGDNRVFENDGSGSFPTSVTFPFGGVDDPRAIAFADIDNDGDLDFLVTQKRTTNRLIRNDYSGGNRWLSVRLTGPQGQAGAFGAKVRAYAAGTNNLLAFREARGAYGYVAQDDPVIHLGLGGASQVDLVVTFLDGSQVALDGLATDQLITVGP